MRYRALVAITGLKLDNMTKAERDEKHTQLLPDILRQWDDRIHVIPYYDALYDTDTEYARLLAHSSRYSDKVNVDDPYELMNFIGKKTGHLFFREIPEEDQKLRESKKAEYRVLTEKYNKKHERIPQDIKDKYRYYLTTPVPAQATGLYAYTWKNPNGMFHSYDFPLTHSYIDNQKNVEFSKLINRNFGTYDDVMKIKDVDFEATYLPNVLFRSDGQMFESYGDDEAGDPEELQAFLAIPREGTTEGYGKNDYLAIIECVI